MTTQIEPVRKNIIFQFVEDVTSQRFVNSSASGLIISSQDSNQSGVSRWGKVIAIGPDVLDVKVGDYILIEHGKWTTGFRHEETRYWKTDEDQVIGVSDTPDKTY